MIRFALVIAASLVMLSGCEKEDTAASLSYKWFPLAVAVPFFFVGVSLGKRAHRAWQQR